MRVVALLAVAALAALPAGCSFMISGCGKSLAGLDTKEKVHADLGEPDRVGVEDGKEFEEYHTRRKLKSDRCQAEGMCAAFTLGATEAICLPMELGLLVVETVFGQTIRFTYYSTGLVKDRYVGILPKPSTLAEQATPSRQEAAEPVGTPLPAPVLAVPVSAESSVSGR